VPVKRKKRSPLKIAKDNAWMWMSRYIRLRDSDEFGMCKCTTCKHVGYYKTMQAGHFIAAAQGNATRYLEDNVHAQCIRCNMRLGGNGAEYYPFMLKRYGAERVDELRRLSNTTLKLSIDEYKAMEAKYKGLVEGDSRWQ
jgi:5-methylcytosine-specific restriction endonuclease McrA